MPINDATFGILGYITFQGHRIALYKTRFYDIDPVAQAGYRYLNDNNLWGLGCLQNGAYVWPVIDGSTYGVGRTPVNARNAIAVIDVGSHGTFYIWGVHKPDVCDSDTLGFAGDPFGPYGGLDPENYDEIADGPLAIKNPGVTQTTIPASGGYLGGALGINPTPGTIPSRGGTQIYDSGLTEDVGLDSEQFNVIESSDPDAARPPVNAYKVSATDLVAIIAMAQSAMGSGWDKKLTADEWCYFFAQYARIPCPAPEDFNFVGAGRNERVTGAIWASRLNGYATTTDGGTPGGAPGGGVDVVTAGLGDLGSLMTPQFLMLAGGAYLLYKGQTLPGAALIAFALLGGGFGK